MIKSWPMLEWYLPDELDLSTQLRHLGTTTREHGSAPRQGETVWVCEIEGQPAALAWEWSEFRPGVLLLADPNCIVSNIRFLDPDHRPAAAPATLVALNRMVHALPWQDTVCGTLEAAPPDPTAAAPAAAVVQAPDPHPTASAMAVAAERVARMRSRAAIHAVASVPPPARPARRRTDPAPALERRAA